MSTRQLLVDYITFEISPTILTEARDANPNAPLIVKGILQKANERNQNGRSYPRAILEREVENYRKNFVNERRAVGELDHPNTSVVELKNVSHNITEVHWEGDSVIGTVEILTTPAGNILRELIKSNIRLGISSRGLGSVRENRDGGVTVGDDFELVAWDFVSNPSTRGAFMCPTSINEGVNGNTVKNQYESAETLMRDIITEITTK